MKYLYAFLALLIQTSLDAQTWVQKAVPPSAIGNNSPLSFSIGSKLYVGGGYISSGQTTFYEYDPATDVWTQKANMPGGLASRGCFVLNGKGYIACGLNSSSAQSNAVYRYNPVTNTWQTMNPFPSTGRQNHTGCSYHGKGYIFGGFVGGGVIPDMWEYNDTTDSWTQKADIPNQSGRNGPVFLVLNNQFFVGMGATSSGSGFSDFYRFDPVANTYTAVTSAPIAREGAANFSIGNYGYVGLGYNSTGLYTNDFYKYEPIANTWIAAPNFGRGVSGNLFSEVVNGKPYVGCGVGNSSSYIDIWTWDSCANYITHLRSDTSLCAGGSLVITDTLSNVSNVWNTGATTPSITATTSGYYSVTATHGVCISSDTVNVSFHACSPPVCTWDSVYYNSWENTTPDPYVIAGTTYGTSPQTYTAHQGTKSLYMNIQNTITAGSLFYDRTFAVCIGATYKLSSWFTTTFSGTQCNINILITDSAGNTITSANNRAIPYSTTWINLLDTFVATSTTIHFKLTTNVAGGNGNDLSMDDQTLFVCQSTTFDTVNICANGNGVLNLFDSIRPALGTGGTWSGPSGLTGGYLGTYDAHTNTSGTYSYSLITGGGCPNGLARIWVLNNTPNAYLGPDDTLSLCSNSTLTLTSPSPSYSNLWSTGSTASSITVSTNGAYGLQVTNNGCVAKDTVSVTFDSCSICPTLTINNDTTICPGRSVALHVGVSGGNVISNVWSPAYALSSTTSATPTATPSVDTTYTVTVTTRSNNSLIFNGDFSQGNVGFSSGYNYTSVQPSGCGPWGILGCPDYYNINTNPRNTHSNFVTVGDHTTGTGNMFIANGATSPSTNVWCESITVLPNTNYEFSAWVTEVSNDPNRAFLKFTINGIAISPAYAPTGALGHWSQFFAIWNSGSNTTINICINDSSIASSGNDFAIDDITFNAVCIEQDSVRITTYKNPVFTLPASASYCDSIHQILTPTITAGTGTFGYLWSPGGSQNMADTALLPGSYSLSMSNQCAASSSSHSTTLTENFSPKPYLGNDTTLCNQASFTIMPTLSGTAPLYHLWQDGSTAATYAASTNGLYWLRDSNICGTASDSLVLTFINTPLPQSIGPVDSTICSGASITLGLTAALPAYDTLTWQDGSHGLTFSTDTAGHYTLTVNNRCGTAVDTSDIHLLGLPAASSLGRDTIICASQTVVLSPTPVPSSATFLWQDAVTTTSSYTATTAGLYILQVSNRCFSLFDSVRVDTMSIPAGFSIGMDRSLCSDSTLVLSPTTAVPIGDSLVWQDLMTHVDTFLVTGPGTYTLSEINRCGQRQASIVISSLLAPTVSLSPIPVQCDKDSVLLDPIAANISTYIWNTGSTAATIYVKSSGSYSVTASNGCGSVNTSVSVVMLQSPIKPFNGMLIDSCQGAMVVLDAGNSGATYLWSNGMSHQVITVSDTGIFYIQISDSGRCSIIDSVYVIDHICPKCRVVSPTGFSPNGDGKNDTFKPIFECAPEIYSLHIYDRWGELVYESSEQNSGWDGSYKGRAQPLGVYMYFVQYRNAGESESKSLMGNITLLR